MYKIIHCANTIQTDGLNTLEQSYTCIYFTNNKNVNIHWKSKHLLGFTLKASITQIEKKNSNTNLK